MRTTLCCSLLLATVSIQAQRPLVISGRASVLPENRNKVMTVLTDAAGDTIGVDRSRSGRFRFRGERSETYLLTFLQPGSTTREVVVNADDLPDIHRDMHVRHIRFHVFMDAGDPEVRLRSLHPVGFSRFNPQAGKLQVEYDHTIERTGSSIIQ